MTDLIKKKIWSIVTVVIYLIVVVFAITTLMSKLSIGGIKLFTVQSGSMEPAIHVGSLVVVKSENVYKVGDVITYKEREDANKTITHRIFKEENTGIERYTTKGDANDSTDSNIVLPSQIIGKVVFSILYLGYPVAFARTIPGLILLVVIPATVIIYEEIRKIHHETKQIVHRRRQKKEEKNSSANVKESKPEHENSLSIKPRKSQ